MAWTSVAELKKSALYERWLKNLTPRQLTRFMEVFSAVHSRVVERGGDEDNAENTALAIALSTAKRANASTRKLEPELHFYAAMTPQQFGGGKDGIAGRLLDFSWIEENPDLASLAVRGNEFNWDHDQAQGIGQVHGIVLRKDAPASIRKKTHRDVPFLFVASYYKDTPPAVKKLATISAEWATLAEEDGIEMPLPLTFAVTKEPLNDPTMGIERVASWAPKKPELEAFVASLTGQTKSGELKTPAPRYKQPRATMPKPKVDEEQDLAEQVASLQEQLKERDDAMEKLQSRVASMKGLEPLAEALASLGEKKKDPTMVLSMFEASLKQLSDAKKTADEKIASIQTAFDAMRSERATEKANEFAAGLVKAGKIKADSTEKWASLFLKDAEAAKTAAEGIAGVGLGENDGKAKGELGLEESAASVLLAEIDPRFAKKKAGEA